MLDPALTMIPQSTAPRWQMMTPHQGFTLIALMVVIAIICILALMVAPTDHDKIVNITISATSVRYGAIYLTFGNNANAQIMGKTLSIRPPIIADAPIVPIAWVCGNAAVPGKMAVKGENRTDMPVGYLPFNCRTRGTDKQAMRTPPRLPAAETTDQAMNQGSYCEPA